MDNQQAQNISQAAHNAGLSLNQLAAFVAEVSGNLQVLASTIQAAMQAAPQTPQQAPTFQHAAPGGAPMGSQPQYAPPGQQPQYTPPGQQPQYSAPGAGPLGNSAPVGGPPNGATGAGNAAANANAPVTAESGKRKRRTKAEIAADEQAIAAGYLSHADMLAKTGAGANVGGNGVASAGTGQAAPAMQQAVPGNGPVQTMQPVQSGVPGAPQQPPAVSGPSPDEAQAAFIRVINAVEQIWPGHGNGQAGILFNRYGGGVQNVALMTPEQRTNIIGWCDYYIQELQAGRLPNGAEGLPAPQAQ